MEDFMPQLIPAHWPLAQSNATQRELWQFAEPLAQQWLLLGIAAFAIIAFAAVVYMLEPKRRRGAFKGVLAGLRALVIAGCVFLLLDPIESQETVEVRDAYTVVLVDKSISMTFKDRYEEGDFTTALSEVTGTSYAKLLSDDRFTRVRQALTNKDLALLETLRQRNKVIVYAFDADRSNIVELEQLEELGEAAKPQPGEEPKGPLVTTSRAMSLLEKVEPDGAATAIGDALNRIQKDLRSEKIAAVILITDGRQNAGSLDPIDEATRFARRKIPIHTVGVGDPKEPKDLILDNLQAPDVSIVGDLISFDAVVKARGYEQSVDVDVELLFNGDVVERTRVSVGGEVKERAVRLRTKPNRPGEYNTEVRITQLPTEQTVENNRATHLLRVIDQRIKVLYIDGYPRWEYRYLKNALIRDRSIEAQCLLLSAEPKFLQETSPGLARLERVPTRQELFEYHVVIIGDVSPEARWPATNEPVFRDSFWEDLSEFVGDFGGGLVLISGERDCPRRFKNTELAKVLPVVIDERSTTTTRYTSVFYPKLTRLGIKSGLMRLDQDETRNADLWSASGRGLPGLYWYEKTIKAKPLARVLAVHPSESNENGDYPIFAWQYYKSGTVFFSAVDSTWRWRAGVGDKFTYKFYSQIIRFLSHGRFQRSKRFSITTDKTEYTIGDDVLITARVYDRDLKPSTAKEQLAELEKPDGTREKVILRAIPEKPGIYEASVRVTARGEYRATLIVGDAGSEDEIQPRKFVVKLPSAELAESRMNEEMLALVAERSGGQFVRLSGIGELPDEIPSMRERIPLATKRRKLWDNEWALIILFSLLALEWVGRKAIRLL